MFHQIKYVFLFDCLNFPINFTLVYFTWNFSNLKNLDSDDLLFDRYLQKYIFFKTWVPLFNSYFPNFLASLQTLLISSVFSCFKKHIPAEIFHRENLNICTFCSTSKILGPFGENYMPIGKVPKHMFCHIESNSKRVGNSTLLINYITYPSSIFFQCSGCCEMLYCQFL